MSAAVDSWLIVGRIGASWCRDLPARYGHGQHPQGYEVPAVSNARARVDERGEKVKQYREN